MASLNGAGRGNRTPDLPLTRRLLYQLSYSGINTELELHILRDADHSDQALCEQAKYPLLSIRHSQYVEFALQQRANHRV
jgi:hypothetical protein